MSSESFYTFHSQSVGTDGEEMIWTMEWSAVNQEDTPVVRRISQDHRTAIEEKINAAIDEKGSDELWSLEEIEEALKSD